MNNTSEMSSKNLCPVPNRAKMFYTWLAGLDFSPVHAVLTFLGFILGFECRGISKSIKGDLLLINICMTAFHSCLFRFNLFKKIKATTWRGSTVCTRARKASAASAPGQWQPPRWTQTEVGRRRGGRSDQGQQDRSEQMEAQNLRKLKLQRGQPS